MFSGFPWVCLPQSLNLWSGNHTRYLRQESYFGYQRKRSHIDQISTLVALCLKSNDELLCLRPLLNWMPNNADSTCRLVEEKLKRPVLHAIIIHCGTKLAMIVPPTTMTDSNTWLLPKSRSYLNWMTRTPKSKPSIITLLKYTMSWYIGGKRTPFYYNLLYCIVELHPTLLQFWVLPNPNTSLRHALS